ncbi:hypothetical protein [Chromobacterium violaceum]|uniref:hypothetical protein n=1 Tax=Chromobacterium violaceum TaxID=536 RepID=UPI0012D480FF|nr:hypothetical protein [Chromobacterium violaceum]
MRQTDLAARRASPDRLAHEAGFALLEVMVALAVLTSMIGLGAVYMNKRNDDLVNQSVANEMQRIGSAAVTYASDKYTDLIKSGDGAWVAVQPGDLQKYLPVGIDLKKGNVLGQQYAVSVHIVQLPGGQYRLDPVVYTRHAKGVGSSPDVADHSLKVAQLMGAGGMYTDWMGRKSGAALDYWSSYGELSEQNLLDKAVAEGKERGRIFYAPFMRGSGQTGDGTLADDVVHRTAHKDHPKWSTMETTLDMNSNSIINIKDVNLKNIDSTIRFMNKSILAVDPDNKEHGIKLDNPNAYKGGDFSAGSLSASRELSAGQVNFKNTKNEGDDCSPLGSLTTNSDGHLLSCQHIAGAKYNLSWVDLQRRSVPFSHLVKSSGSAWRVPMNLKWDENQDSSTAKYYSNSWTGFRGSWAPGAASHQYVSESIRNNGDEPILIFASAGNRVKTGLDGKFTESCGLAVFPEDEDRGGPSSKPIITQTSGPVYGASRDDVSAGHYTQGTGSNAGCFVSFIVEAKHKVYVAAQEDDQRKLNYDDDKIDSFFAFKSTSGYQKEPIALVIYGSDSLTEQDVVIDDLERGEG